MKITCDVIKDLLPLYIDDVLSDDSKSIVEEHFQDCEECRKLYEVMIADNKVVNVAEEYDGFGKSMKKVKRHFNIRTIVAVLLALALSSAICFVVFIGVVPTLSTNVEIVPEAYIREDNGFGEKDIQVAFHLKLKNENRCIDARFGLLSKAPTTEEALAGRVYETVYSQVKIPFDDRGKHPNCMDLYFTYEDTDHIYPEEMTLHFRDKDVTYNMKDIIEQAGLLLR